MCLHLGLTVKIECNSVPDHKKSIIEKRQELMCGNKEGLMARVREWIVSWWLNIRIEMPDILVGYSAIY